VFYQKVVGRKISYPHQHIGLLGTPPCAARLLR
jgi:hypothetical protein